MSVLYNLGHSEIEIPEVIVNHINKLPVKRDDYAAFDLDNTLLIGDIGDAVFALLSGKGLI